jgi:hypothetical protein
MDVALSNLAIDMATQHQIAQSAIAQPGMLGATQEIHSVAKAEMSGRDDLTMSVDRRQVAQNALVTDFANSQSSATMRPAQPITERQLFDYLAEIEKSGAGNLADPSALVKAAIHSLQGMLEHAEATFGEVAVPSTSNADAPLPSGAAPEMPSDQAATKTSGGNGADAAPFDEMDQTIEELKSTLLTLFSASLAVSSVTAATSSTNALIRQQ